MLNVDNILSAIFNGTKFTITKIKNILHVYEHIAICENKRNMYPHKSTDRKKINKNIKLAQSGGLIFNTK